MPEKILTVEDLEIKFELRGKTLHAIRGISMELHRGEILAIVGESGSGKSVFTKSFMGLLDQNGHVTAGKATSVTLKYAPDADLVFYESAFGTHLPDLLVQ